MSSLRPRHLEPEDREVATRDDRAWRWIAGLHFRRVRRRCWPGSTPTIISTRSTFPKMPRLEQAHEGGHGGAASTRRNSRTADVAMGYYHYYGSRDYERALAKSSPWPPRTPSPTTRDMLEAMAYVLRRQGRWDDAASTRMRPRRRAGPARRVDKVTGALVADAAAHAPLRPRRTTGHRARAGQTMPEFVSAADSTSGAAVCNFDVPATDHRGPVSPSWPRCIKRDFDLHPEVRPDFDGAVRHRIGRDYDSSAAGHASSGERGTTRTR